MRNTVAQIAANGMGKGDQVCLKFYGLTRKAQVGIVQAQVKSEKVISL